MALPINAQSIDLRTILQGRQDRQNYEAGQQRNRLTELALEQAPQRMAAEQEAQTMQQQRNKLQFSQEQEQAVGTALGGAAIQMLQPLSNGDFASAESILDQTSQQLAASGLQLPEGPLRNALRTKNTRALQSILTGTITTAQQRGWLKAPPKSAADPKEIALFEYAKQQGYKGGFEDFLKQQGGAGGPVYGQYLVGPDGNYYFGDRRSPQVQPVTSGEQQVRAFAADPDAQAAVVGAKEGAKLDAQRGASINEKARDETEVGRLLDLADPLLDRATGSGIGAALDAAGNLVGASSDGANASAELRALGGMLVARMPRMEGPQSNFDVQNYQIMAGRIGDPTVPAPQKRAAMRTIREINSRYTRQGQPTAAAPAQQPQQPSIDDLLRKYGGQ